MRRSLSTFAGLALLALGCVERAEVLSPGPDGGDRTNAVTSVALGEAHACAVTDSRLYCWGSNASGELGLGDTIQRDEPALVAGPWLEVTAGEEHTCARDDLGRVACWGANERGQLGVGDREARGAPEIVTLPFPATHVVSNFDHTCALLTNASLYCWGKNDEGEMGQGDPFPGGQATAADALSPIALPDTWRAVDTGQGHTCAIRLDGALYCWGRNTQNQLGDVDSDQVREPTPVGTGSDWLAVEAGQNHTCSVREDRYAYCWGENNGIDTEDGAPLGIPGAALLATPTRVDGAGDVSVLRSDTFHTCAVTRDARFLCWGRNIEGQLGLGDDALRETPTPVGSGYRGAAVGRFTTCAVSEGGSLECTGDNRAGQLGAGDTMRRFTLTPVEFPAP